MARKKPLQSACLFIVVVIIVIVFAVVFISKFGLKRAAE